MLASATQQPSRARLAFATQQPSQARPASEFRRFSSYRLAFDILQLFSAQLAVATELTSEPAPSFEVGHAFNHRNLVVRWASRQPASRSSFCRR